MHRRNARIIDATLGFHGLSLTSHLTVEFEGGAVKQGFGGLRLAHVGMEDDAASWWITGILNALSLEDWNQLVGQFIRVESETETGPLLRIGHIMNNQWFDIRELPKKKEA